MAAPGEQKRKLDVFVPIGADDGDKILIDGEGHPSEFHGKHHLRRLVDAVQGHCTIACCMLSHAYILFAVALLHAILSVVHYAKASQLCM